MTPNSCGNGAKQSLTIECSFVLDLNPLYFEANGDPRDRK